MAKRKKLFPTGISTEAASEYCDLLSRLMGDLDTMIYELESRTTQQASGSVPTELIFDAVPILRRLKDARNYTRESIAHFGG